MWHCGFIFSRYTLHGFKTKTNPKDPHVPNIILLESGGRLTMLSMPGLPMWPTSLAQQVLDADTNRFKKQISELLTEKSIEGY